MSDETNYDRNDVEIKDFCFVLFVIFKKTRLTSAVQTSRFVNHQLDCPYQFLLFLRKHV